MKIEIQIDKTIQSLIEWKKSQFLEVNHEYQRAPVWKSAQEQMFIDSIFRGYSIPAFYFHHKKTSKDGLSKEVLEIIDGQQRINAIYDYYEGAYILLDPKDSKFKFPNFVEGEECPWAGKRYKDLNEDLKTRFLEQSVVIYRIEAEDENEIRDLFIRLQGGIPLSPQEKRDSWPGGFTDFVMGLGGKYEVKRYPGHHFFTHVAKPSGGESNKRKLAAQVALLYFHRRESERRSFCDIKSVNIDNFYHQKINFSSSSEEAKRFYTILDKLVEIFKNEKIKPIKGHYAIDLTLLVDNLLDDYAAGWDKKLFRAFIEFHKNYLAAAEAVKKDIFPEEKHQKYYDSYVRWTSAKTDLADTIRRRHEFFSQEMLSLLDLKKKDPKRAFGIIEKEIIYYRDEQMCQVCKMRGDSEIVPWNDAQFHHVQEHHQGGESTIDNGALVHKNCHPRSKEDVNEFYNWWINKESGNSNEKKENLEFPPPEGTECQFKYRGNTYYGEIKKKKLVVDGHGTYGSFSSASGEVTGTSRNGWRDWEIKLPEHENWIIADDWRRQY